MNLNTKSGRVNSISGHQCFSVIITLASVIDTTPSTDSIDEDNGGSTGIQVGIYFISGVVVGVVVTLGVLVGNVVQWALV